MIDWHWCLFHCISMKRLAVRPVLKDVYQLQRRVCVACEASAKKKPKKNSCLEFWLVDGVCFHAIWFEFWINLLLEIVSTKKLWPGVALQRSFCLLFWICALVEFCTWRVSLLHVLYGKSRFEYEHWLLRTHQKCVHMRTRHDTFIADVNVNIVKLCHNMNDTTDNRRQIYKWMFHAHSHSHPSVGVGKWKCYHSLPHLTIFPWHSMDQWHWQIHLNGPMDYFVHNRMLLLLWMYSKTLYCHNFDCYNLTRKFKNQ